MTQTLPSTGERLLNHLSERNLISPAIADTLKRGNPDTASNNTALTAVRRMRKLTEDQIADAFQQINIHRANLTVIDGAPIEIIGYDTFYAIMEQYGIMPYGIQSDKRVLIATDDPTDQHALDKAASLFNSGVVFTYATRSQQAQALDIAISYSNLMSYFDQHRAAFPNVTDEDYELARANATHVDTVPSALVRMDLLPINDAYSLYARYTDMTYQGYLPQTTNATMLKETRARQMRILVISADTDSATILTDHYTPPEHLQAELACSYIQVLFTTPEILNAAYDEAYAVTRDIPPPNSVTEALVQMGKLPDSVIHDEDAGEKALNAGQIEEQDYFRALAIYKGLPYIDIATDPPDPAVLSQIPNHTIKDNRAYPHSVRNGELIILIADPRQRVITSTIQRNVKGTVSFAVTTPTNISKLLHREITKHQNITALDADVRGRNANTKTNEIPVDDNNSTMRVIHDLIQSAVLENASDIHLEQREHGLNARFRIDGDLITHATIPSVTASSIITSIKNLANLKIEEKVAPQSGRIVYNRETVDLNLRVETSRIASGIEGGEKVVMRLLRKNDNLGKLDTMKLNSTILQNFRASLSRPHGLILITGPTGSGKTTTIFSALKEIAVPTKNVLTAEDPVEITIPGISQHEVNEQRNVTMENLLRSFLRQDPDIILVGEIRDARIAKVAIEAALTGHLVIASLHTNTAPGAITRLREMGIEDFNLSGSLNGIMAQRLVQQLCTECREPYLPTDQDVTMFRELGLAPDTLYRQHDEGCPHCGKRGFKGRIPIHEYLTITPAVKMAISQGKTEKEIIEIAMQDQRARFEGMYSDGIRKVAEGYTTREKIVAATSED